MPINTTETYTYFFTRVGKVPITHFINYDSEIEPKIKSVDFIPDKEYLNDLFESDFHFSLIFDERSFHSFVSDIQTISSLNSNKAIKRAWEKTRKDSFKYCLWVQDASLKSKIKSNANNLLNEDHLLSIRITFLEYPDGISTPKGAISHYLKKIQVNDNANVLSQMRGKSITFNFPITPFKQGND